MESVRSKAVARGHIENGELRIHSESDFRKALGRMTGEVVIVVEPLARRSERMNAYYFGAMQWLSNEIGWDVDDIHEWNKIQCNPVRRFLFDKNGEIKDEKPIGGSTRKLKTAEFGEFLDRVRMYWANQGYAIPENYWETS